MAIYLTVGNTRIPLPVSVSRRSVYCILVGIVVCSGVLCTVDLSCSTDLLHAGVAMVIVDIYLSLYLLLAPRLFNFTSDGRGKIEFKGNMLFTHFSEINSPTIGTTDTVGLNIPEPLAQNDLPDEALNSGKP